MLFQSFSSASTHLYLLPLLPLHDGAYLFGRKLLGRQRKINYIQRTCMNIYNVGPHKDYLIRSPYVSCRRDYLQFEKYGANFHPCLLLFNRMHVSILNLLKSAFRTDSLNSLSPSCNHKMTSSSYFDSGNFSSLFC